MISYSILLTIRSPSPEPIYSTDGKRLNTREVRARKKLEDDRHDCIQAAMAINPEYRAPIDYKLVHYYCTLFTCTVHVHDTTYTICTCIWLSAVSSV